MRASVVVVGNEILSGHTQDANGPYLARQLSRMGHRVEQITIVPDTLEVIAEALADAADAELVFVCGGLGPTRDDVTIDAVGAFLERELTTPEEAKEQVRRIYRAGKERGYLESDEVDERAWRMARVPDGGTVVPNEEGVAPGSVHDLGTSLGQGRLFVLPGPPAELQSVFARMIDRGLVPQEREQTVQEVHLNTFEAPVARALDEVDEAVPEVEMGSYPQHGEKRVIVRFTGEGDEVQRAVAELRKRLGDIEMERPEG